MKKFSLLFLILLSGTFVFSQEQKTIKPVTTIKGADSKENRPGEKKAENKTEEIKQEEPVIIQTLEFKLDENQNSNNGNQENKQKEIHTRTAAKNTEVKEEKTVDEQILDLNTYIAAIEKKVEWVRNNPEEDKKAKENGWYAQMKKSYEEAVLKRDNLTNSKK